MSICWAHGYPADGPGDWTSDGADYEEGTGCFKRKPGEDGELPIYKHQMREHITRRIWRECAIFNKENNPWLTDCVREYLVIGPFPGDDKPYGGLNHPYINESKGSPKLNSEVGGKIWKLASAPGRYPNIGGILGVTEPDKVCYAAFAVESDTEQIAVIRTQRNGGWKIWQDGKLILDSPWNRTFDTEPNTIDVQLKKGKNIFLVKLNNVACDWAFYIRMTDLTGQPLSGAKFTLP